MCQMVFLGFMVCGVLAGYVADRYGRWKVTHTLTLSHTRCWWSFRDAEKVSGVCVQVLLGGFVWSSYFSLLTSFAPSYGWFIFLRSMVGCGVAAVSQGSAHTHTPTQEHTGTHTHTLSLLFQVHLEDRVHSCSTSSSAAAPGNSESHTAGPGLGLAPAPGPARAQAQVC